VRFILGGARSGKSRYAESLAKTAEESGQQVFYLATATSSDRQNHADTEMLERIKRHQSDRPSHWQTIEVPIKLAEGLVALDDKKNCILIDCLTLWTLNLLEEECFQVEKKALLNVLPNLTADIILVSNEVGLGVVPMGKLTRCFVDELGWLHQAVAEQAETVTFVTAGLPMHLK